MRNLRPVEKLQVTIGLSCVYPQNFKTDENGNKDVSRSTQAEAEWVMEIFRQSKNGQGDSLLMSLVIIGYDGRDDESGFVGSTIGRMLNEGLQESGRLARATERGEILARVLAPIRDSVRYFGVEIRMLRDQ